MMEENGQSVEVLSFAADEAKKTAASSASPAVTASFTVGSMPEYRAMSAISQSPVSRNFNQAEVTHLSGGGVGDGGRTQRDLGSVTYRSGGSDIPTQAEAGSGTCRSDSGDGGRTLAKAGSVTYRSGGSDGQTQSQGGGRSGDGDGRTQAEAGCTTCRIGVGDGQNLHRLKRDGAIRLYCSSCVLFHHKGMYCCQCFHVYRDPSQLGDPALWLTCSKCHRLSHMDCARNQGLATDSFFFTCQYCHKQAPTEADEGSPALKKLRVSTSLQDSPSLSDQETLAAAQIVAAVAANEAKEAKGRARASAAVAAKAASLAKTALDAAYRAGQEEVRWRLEASKHTLEAASTVQIVRAVNTGANTLDMRKQETTVGLDDRSRCISHMPPNEGSLGKHPGNVLLGGPGGSRAASTSLSQHKRRILPPVVAPDGIRTPLTPLQHGTGVLKQQQQPPPMQKESQLLCAATAGGQYGSLSSLQEEQNLLTVSEGVAVSASPESILEGSTLLGTPRSGPSTVPAHPDVGLPKRDAERSNPCSGVLPGENSHGTSQVTVLKSSLVVPHGRHIAADGHDSMPCSLSGTPDTNTLGLAGKLANDVDDDVLEIFPPSIDEETVDDLMYVGDLLTEGLEKEGNLSSGLAEVEGGSSVPGVSEGALVRERTGEDRTGCMAPVKCENGAGLGVPSNQLSSTSEETTQTGQPSGSTMAVPSKGETPSAYSLSKSSGSAAYSAPLQATGITELQ